MNKLIFTVLLAGSEPCAAEKAALANPYYIPPRSGAQHIALSENWQLSWRDSAGGAPQRNSPLQPKWITRRRAHQRADGAAPGRRVAAPLLQPQLGEVQMGRRKGLVLPQELLTARRRARAIRVSRLRRHRLLRPRLAQWSVARRPRGHVRRAVDRGRQARSGTARQTR